MCHKQLRRVEQSIAHSDHCRVGSSTQPVTSHSKAGAGQHNCIGAMDWCVGRQLFRSSNSTCRSTTAFESDFSEACRLAAVCCGGKSLCCSIRAAPERYRSSVGSNSMCRASSSSGWSSSGSRQGYSWCNSMPQLVAATELEEYVASELRCWTATGDRMQ